MDQQGENNSLPLFDLVDKVADGCELYSIVSGSTLKVQA